MQGIRAAYGATSDEEHAVAEFQGFLDLAKLAGVERVVRLSAMSADPQAKSDLSRRHGLREKALEKSGLAWTHLRPTWFMQMMLEYAPDGRLDLPGGDGRIGWIDTRDIAAVAVAALTQDGHVGKIHELTGPAALSYQELADTMLVASPAPSRDSAGTTPTHSSNSFRQGSRSFLLTQGWRVGHEDVPQCGIERTPAERKARFGQAFGQNAAARRQQFLTHLAQRDQKRRGAHYGVEVHP